MQKLQAIADFSLEKWEPAIEAFIRLDITPAKVISLFPENTISGRLHEAQDRWVTVFGGPEDGHLIPSSKVKSDNEKADDHEKLRGVTGVLKSVVHLGGSTRKDTASIKGKEEDTASVHTVEGSGHSVKSEPVEYKGRYDIPLATMQLTDSDLLTVYPPAALEALMLFLSDRRQKLTGAMSSSAVPPPAISALPPFKDIPPSELLAYPDVPFSDLSPEQLVRVAQIVYTALLKVYLAIRPILVGSLCRIENWCEVEEVEELLREKKVRP